MPMMKCGCQSNATTADNLPACAVHAGLTPDALVVDDSPVDLTGRFARCYCGRTSPSENHEMLAFFSLRPGKEFDSYYCGCRGWD